MAAVSTGTVAPGGSVALGFVRLSILDLTPLGAQPMVIPERAALAFNGEIYNYLELREELQTLGWTFASTGDTEVLLKGWLQWGEELFSRLNGMWALAIYDWQRDGVLLSRDRFGEKPLFWTRWRSGVAFASEVKQLAMFPGLRLEVDPQAAVRFLRSGRPYDGPSSWFAGVHQVEPGGLLWVDSRGLHERRYWSIREAIRRIPPSSDALGWQDRFAQAFADSVRLRLRSDVAVGTSLSAGVDSSAVLAQAVRLGSANYNSFTLTSGDRRIDEGEQAARFARDMGSTWHGVPAVGDEFAQVWDRMTWHQEAPLASTSLFGQWKVLEAARAAGVTVLLDGQGADEILGGYQKFLAAAVVRRFANLDPESARLAWAFLRHLSGPRTVLDSGYRYLGRLAGGAGPDPWLRTPTSGVARAPSIRTTGLRMRLADIERWSLPNLLAYVDRSAMAFGIETRLPFLDPDVVTLALAMPDDVLLHLGWSKWPLRQTLANLGGSVPAWRRGKRWFGVPQRDWLRGPLAGLVHEWSDSPHQAWSAFADIAAMRAFAGSWWIASRTTAATDDLVFAAVAIDRFLRRWVS